MKYSPLKRLSFVQRYPFSNICRYSFAVSVSPIASAISAPAFSAARYIPSSQEDAPKSSISSVWCCLPVITPSRSGSHSNWLVLSHANASTFLMSAQLFFNHSVSPLIFHSRYDFITVAICPSTHGKKYSGFLPSGSAVRNVISPFSAVSYLNSVSLIERSRSGKRKHSA